MKAEREKWKMSLGCKMLTSCSLFVEYNSPWDNIEFLGFLEQFSETKWEVHYEKNTFRQTEKDVL